MSAKPSTIQVCNTQACSETRADGNNSINVFVTYFPRSGKECTNWQMNITTVVRWDGNLIYTQSSNFDSVNVGGYNYRKNYQFYYNRDDNAHSTCSGAFSEVTQYAVTRTPL